MANCVSPGPESQSATRELLVVGSSHKTAPLEVLESLSLPPEEIAKCLLEIKARFGFHEVLFLSTCNRTEVYAVSENPAGDENELQSYLLELAEGRRDLNSSHLYARMNGEAVRHLFAVTCGLEAMMLGETEITGQVQTALSLAIEAGVCGNYMVQLVSEAFRTSKRIRNETAFGKGTTSVASAAVHLARRVFGDLSMGRILIVGAGETAGLVGKHLLPDRPQKLLITNRTQSRAEDLARELAAETVPFGDWDGALAETDVVVCATHSKVPLLTQEMIQKAVGPSQSRILLLIDISLPLNIEKSVSEVDNVFLYDMNDLKSIVQKNLDRRAKEVSVVKQIIDEEQKQFFFKQATLEIGPLIRDLRGRFEEVRKRELARFTSKFAEEDRQVAERLTRDLVNKLLHHPTVELRSLGNELDANRDRLSWVRRLFGLHED